MKTRKTNAMRHLDTLKLPYEHYEFDLKEAADAVTVASLLKSDAAKVFKTLVTVANDGEHFVFMVPAARHLSLKKAAKAAGKKKVEMIAQKQLLPLTGYVHGGCSPLGMKKQFVTFMDSSALEQDKIFFSGGKIGVQIEMDPHLLQQAAGIKAADICED